MLNTTQSSETLDATAAVLSTPPPAVFREEAAIQAGYQRLAKIEGDLPQIKAQLQQLMDTLGKAENEASQLRESLPLKREALELLCAQHKWALPSTFTQPPAWPTPQQTGAYPVPQLPFEAPVSPRCPELGCGAEMKREHGVWLHTANNSKECPARVAEPLSLEGDDPECRRCARSIRYRSEDGQWLHADTDQPECAADEPAADQARPDGGQQ